MISVAFLREPNKSTVSLKDSIHLNRIAVLKRGGVVVSGVVVVKGRNAVVVFVKLVDDEEVVFAKNEMAVDGTVGVVVGEAMVVVCLLYTSPSPRDRG